MDVSVTLILCLVLLLAACCLALPLASRYAFPYSALLVAIGMAASVLADVPGAAALPAPLADALHAAGNFALSPHAFLYVFLPSLLFAAGLSVDVRRLMDDVAAVLIMAIVAVVVCTLVVGLWLSAAFAVPLAVALLLGSVIATTDPAAVVAIFRDIGVPRRLQILVEGESLFNDAAAIALFSLLVASVSGLHSGGVAAGLTAIVGKFSGGLLLGWVAARLFCSMMRWVGEHAVAEVTLTVCLAYAIYIVGDVYLDVSGVVATVTAALVVGSTGRAHLSAEGWERLHSVWHQIEFLASTLIFVLAATAIPRLFPSLRIEHAAMLAVVVLATLLARAAVLYGLIPLLGALRLGQDIRLSHKTVILWGGMRGAVTLALALSVAENPAIPRAEANLVAVLATGLVLFTLFVNAPSLQPLIRLLGLNRLSPVEAVLRERSIALAGESVRKHLAVVRRHFGLDEAVTDDHAADAAAPAADLHSLGYADAQTVGLITLAAQEEELILQGFGERTISRRTIGLCLAHAGRLHDAAKTGGLEAYLRVADAALQPPAAFRAALWLYNRFGIAGPLAGLLGLRFQHMLITRTVLQRLQAFTRRSIGPMLGDATEMAIAAALETRLAGVETAMRAFEVQYPDYAHALRSDYLGRAALRLEEAEYMQKRADGLISPEVYRSLAEDMQRRRQALNRRPVLDLGLQLTAMIRGVPLFAGLSETQLRAVAHMLRPRLAVPGECIIRKGDRGDAMYFITAGSVDISNSIFATQVVRKAGGFFGEIALLYNTPRTAAVHANGYCHLLELRARDLQRLLRQHPEAREEIERAARQRMNPEREVFES
ncbi:MAG: cation:proton antiporter [Rhodocyclaceae bacterium]|nr:cation:proton antiporter [Rhodocyclaceae bacterium]MBX3667862.1 cation:proton antiporter [Rhodocyclaceae bacterium]